MAKSHATKKRSFPWPTQLAMAGQWWSAVATGEHTGKHKHKRSWRLGAAVSGGRWAEAMQLLRRADKPSSCAPRRAGARLSVATVRPRAAGL
jgi:hypothetical protein